GNRDAIADLLPFLKSDRPGRQSDAIRALSSLDAPQTVGEIALLLKSSDAEVRQTAVQALGSLSARAALPLLRPLLQDREGKVRTAVVGALAELEDRDSIPTMIQLLDDPDPDVCSAACTCLRILRAREALPALEIQYEAGRIRSEALLALAVLGTPQTARTVFRHIGEREDYVFAGYVTEEIPHALGLLEARDLIPDLRKLLKHRYAPLRAQAAVALGELGDRESIPDLLKLLGDPHSFVLASAADALGRLQATEAIPRLRRILREYPSDVFHSGGPPGEVVEALLRLRAREAIPELLAELRRTHVGTIDSVLEALQQFRDPSIIPELVSILTSEDAPFASEDKTVLLEDRGRIPAVVYCTGLGGLVDSAQTYSVPEILANLGAREYLPDIEKLLELGSMETRMAAAQALCRLGSSKGVPIILSEAANGNTSGLLSLNALRRPLLWARMREMRFPKSRSVLRSEVMEQVAQTLGLGLELAEPSRLSLTWPTRRHQIRCYEEQSLLLDVVQKELEFCSYTLVLEDDRIRVIRDGDAVPFWKEWWANAQTQDPKVQRGK
ncbi:MAG TPA: HEAT repeat domain-containing protein, partial [Planctomycetota bacterium]|nr:HEAT repeat domain-containing protein [Planctomycetota bacterium]